MGMLKRAFSSFFLTLSLLLLGCGVPHIAPSSTKDKSSASQTNSSLPQNPSSPSQSAEPSSSSSPSSSSLSPVIEEPITYHFYAVNDFHGAINPNGGEPGLSKMGGFLKQKKNEDPEHTILLSSGDMWQGSLESNYSKGAFVTKAMNEIGFDAMTLGNHEFDYGQDVIQANQKIANFPFLAGNIRKWSNGGASSASWGITSASTVLERNGFKIGIIGMIGEGQTSSITSKYVNDITFVKPIPLAIKESQRLKSEEGCSIVVLSIHNDASSVLKEQNTLKPYFDGVFCAHTHRVERSTSTDGVPLLQGGSNGIAYSHFDLTLEKDGSVTCANAETPLASSSWANDAGLDSLLSTDLETDDFKAMASENLGTLSGYMDSTAVGALGAKAIFTKYVKQYPNLVCAMNNGQRHALYAGALTYSDLYQAAPFMNSIVLFNALGSEIINEARYNTTYTGDTTTYSSLVSSKTYLVAVIDYLAYHQNAKKRYNYFSSFDPSKVVAEYETYPVDLSAEYLKSLGGKIDVSEFSPTATGMNLYR